MKKSARLSLNSTDFRELADGEFFYCDKTNSIKALMEHPSKAIQLSRPQGFGKSLGLSMLYNFLSSCPGGRDLKGDTALHARLFSGLEILQDDFFCNQYMGQHPVIQIRFSHASFSSFELTHSVICSAIVNTAKQFSFLSQSANLAPEDRLKYSHLVDYYHLMNHYSDLSLSLYELSRLLHLHFNRSVCLLADDVDIPLSAAAKYGYYRELSELLSHMFTSAIDSNEYLAKAVMGAYLPLKDSLGITGCHYSDLNDNPELVTFTGFTAAEIQRIAAETGIETDLGKLSKWYGGYQTGAGEMYSAASTLRYFYNASSNPQDPESAYAAAWMETDRCHNLPAFLQHMYSHDAALMKTLIDGEIGKIEKLSHVSYKDLSNRKSGGYWQYLLSVGCIAETGDGSETGCLAVTAPNLEMRTYLAEQVQLFFSSRNELFCKNARYILSALAESDPQKLANVLSWCLKTYISPGKGAPLARYHSFIAGYLECFYESEISYISSMDGKYSGERSWLAFIYDTGEFGSKQSGYMSLV